MPENDSNPPVDAVGEAPSSRPFCAVVVFGGLSFDLSFIAVLLVMFWDKGAEPVGHPIGAAWGAMFYGVKLLFIFLLGGFPVFVVGALVTAVIARQSTKIAAMIAAGIAAVSTIVILW